MKVFCVRNQGVIIRGLNGNGKNTVKIKEKEGRKGGKKELVDLKIGRDF